LPDEPLLGFIEIPAGPFTMGSNDPEDSFLDIEKASPAHPLTLPTYYIARYPVTVAQFRAFVEARGHRPANERCLHGLANHPAVYVSWQDARAYCKWLTEQMQQQPEKTPASLAEFLRQPEACVTLPSEAEWEKAARGPEGFVYPWGNEPDPNCANYADTGIDATSTVGCFPGGASVAYRVEELSGNVWEWTRSVLGDYPYPEGAQERAERELLQSDGTEPRVLRGGCFADVARNCRCALRNRVIARYIDFVVGFRVVLAALPSSNL